MKNKLRRLKKIYNINKKLIKDLDFYDDARFLKSKETEKQPKRYDIINFLLLSFDRDTNYLEIGVRNPVDNFDKIKSLNKYSVDPGVEFIGNPVDFKLTSDEFFLSLREGSLPIGSNIKFDVVFIDGLHLADQVSKDIDNSLNVLKEDGFVVLHDCNPPTFFHAREDY